MTVYHKLFLDICQIFIARFLFFEFVLKLVIIGFCFDKFILKTILNVMSIIVFAVVISFVFNFNYLNPKLVFDPSDGLIINLIIAVSLLQTVKFLIGQKR